MTHFDGVAELDPYQNRPLFRLLDHLGAIVKAGCLAPPPSYSASEARLGKRSHPAASVPTVIFFEFHPW